MPKNVVTWNGLENISSKNNHNVLYTESVIAVIHRYEQRHRIFKY